MCFVLGEELVQTIHVCIYKNLINTEMHESEQFRDE